MASLKPEQVDEQIRSGTIGKLYLFDGPEAFLKERAIDRIVEKLVSPESRDFNLDRLDGRSCTGGQVVTALQNLPFLGDRRVVVLTSADELSAADSRLVGEALGDVPDSTCLLMTWDGRAGLRDEIPARVSSNGAVVTCWTPFPNVLPSWLMNEARQRGKPIAPEAAAAVCDACGDLQQIVNEYEKLSLFVGAKPKIELSDVRQHGLPDEEGDYKELESAIWHRDLREMLRQGHLLSESGLRAESIFPVYERVLRTLVLAHHLRDERREGMDSIFAALGARGKTQRENLSKGMAMYRPEDAREALDRVAQADHELKTGVLPGPIGVSLLALDIGGGRANAVARGPAVNRRP